MKPGLRTTEFVAVLLFGGIAILSGLDITDGVVNFHLNADMMGDMKYIVLTYVGGRSAIKAVQVAKKPSDTLADDVADTLADDVAAKLMEKAK